MKDKNEDKPRYRTLLEELDTNIEPYVENEEATKKKRGGARPGAGRKRVYKPYEVRRLKCRLEHSGLANAFISILDKFSNKLNMKAWACRLDGSAPREMGKGMRTWTENDAISSEFSLYINKSCDSRIFAVAFRKALPIGVMVDVIHDGDVRLRWQRADEVARLMTEYGWLMARRKQLDNETESLLREVPMSNADIPDWINND